MQCSSINLQNRLREGSRSHARLPCYLMWDIACWKKPACSCALRNYAQTLDSIKERLGFMGAMCRAGLSLVRLACLCLPSGKRSWEDVVPLPSRWCSRSPNSRPCCWLLLWLTECCSWNDACLNSLFSPWNSITDMLKLSTPPPCRLRPEACWLTRTALSMTPIKGRGFNSGFVLKLPLLLIGHGASGACCLPPSDRFPLEAWLELEPLEPVVPAPPPSRLTSIPAPKASARPSRATEWVESLSEPLEKLEERGWYICRGPGGEELLGDIGW